MSEKVNTETQRSTFSCEQKVEKLWSWPWFESKLTQAARSTFARSDLSFAFRAALFALVSLYVNFGIFGLVSLLGLPKYRIFHIFLLLVLPMVITDPTLAVTSLLPAARRTGL